MGLIPAYKEGADLTLLDCFYTFPQKNELTGKWDKDFMTVLYKDNSTGEKKHEIILQPEYEFFKAKDNIQLNYPRLFIEKDKVIPITTPYTKLLKTIAEETGTEEYFYENLQNGNKSANQELHTLYNIFNSDMNIADHYRFKFDKQYRNEPIPITKAFFDIEADTIHMAGDFPQLGECPINAVSYIFGNHVTSFLLRDPGNPQVEEFEKSISPELFKELQDFIIENVDRTGKGKAKVYGVDNLDFTFLFFDEEIALIQALFMLINKNEPDFLLAWNMAFDIPYIIERLIELGYDPKDIMCHPSFAKEERVVKYFLDYMHQNNYDERGDYYRISGHTVYLDELIHFASRRKGQAAFPDFKLDTAGDIIVGVKKADYSHITTKLSELPRLNYKLFVFYNIMDTIVQKCIEGRVNDIDFVFGKSLVNNTRYEKCHRQTVYLCNRAAKVFDAEGYIIGNNQNRHTEAVPFEGAMVGEPLNNSDYSKLCVDGQVLNIVDNAVDNDFKSLYPSIDNEFNMGPNTQIGKVYIDEPVFENENPFGNKFYDRGGQFVRDLLSQNYIEFCHRWLHYPSFDEWVEDIKYYFTFIEPPVIRSMNFGKAFTRYEEGANPMRAFEYSDNPRKAFTIMPKKIDYTPYLKGVV